MAEKYRLIAGDKVYTTREEILAQLSHKIQGKDTSTRFVSTRELLITAEHTLDIGCGIGVYSKEAAKSSKRVIGIDISRDSLKIANDFFNASNIEYKEGDMFELDLPLGYFDQVIFLETIEHVDDPVVYLRRIHELLKPGGTLIISTPNAVSYFAFKEQLRNRFTNRGIKNMVSTIHAEKRNSGTDLDHIFCWDFNTFYRLLHRNGFIYLDHRFTNYPLFSYKLMHRLMAEMGFLRPVVKSFCASILFKLKKDAKN